MQSNTCQSGSRGVGIISDQPNHILHVMLDVIAKSSYGFALMFFRNSFDKKLARKGIEIDRFSAAAKEQMMYNDGDYDDSRACSRESSLHGGTSKSQHPRLLTNFCHKISAETIFSF